MINYTNTMQQHSLLYARQHPFFVASISEPAHFERVSGVTLKLSAENSRFCGCQIRGISNLTLFYHATSQSMIFSTHSTLHVWLAVQSFIRGER